MDSSGWYAALRPADPAHPRVAAVLRERVQAGARLVTCNLVVAEVHALLVRRAGRDVALRFLAASATAPNAVVSSSPALEERARSDWLERYGDQRFSLTDAVAFVIMTERGIREALTLDHHFAVARFTMVPGV